MTPALNKALPEFEALATGGIKFTPQAFADKIVVLKDGVVAEEGSHSALLAHGGVYANLYRIQQGGPVDAAA